MKEFVDRFSVHLFVVSGLLIISSLGNGVMDTVSFHYQGSIFSGNEQFWNPKVSWENKYAKGPDGILRPYKPRYWGSTTILSFTTDGWHLCKAIFLWFNRFAFVAFFDIVLLIYGVKGLRRYGLWIVAYTVVSILYIGGFNFIYKIL